MTNLIKIKDVIDEKVKTTGKTTENISRQLEEIYKKYIPARFVSADIEKIDKELQNFCLDFDRNNGLYLYGECGTGKTYAFYAMQKLFIVNNLSSKIYNATILLNEIRKGFDKKTDWRGQEINFLEDISEMTGVLIIDDIGSEKLTDWVGETFYSIINTRYEKMLPTFFSSNLSLPELADKMGDRIASRIAEMCKIIKLSGGDKRII